MAATHKSWDISGAFLKGFSFEKVRKTPERRAAAIPPPNVWRHLSGMDGTLISMWLVWSV